MYFLTFLVLHFDFFKIKSQLIRYLNFLRQVRWFVTWWVETNIISSDENHTQNIIRETIEVEKKEMDQVEMSLQEKASYRKQYKINYVKKTSSMFYTVKRNTVKISKAIVRETPRMLSATYILSVSIVKQGRFIKRE